MKTPSFSLVSGLVAVLLITAVVTHAQGGGTVNFANDGSTLVVNALTASPATGVKAALYWAPTNSSVFTQLGNSVTVGVPLAGVFADGTRTSGAATAGGSVGQFQVRVWSDSYATYEDALAVSGSLVGTSAVLQVTTGNPAGDPPTPPGSLVAAGLQTVTLNSSLPPCPVITLSPATLAEGVVGQSYSNSVSASGGVGSYAYSDNGTLSNGLTLSSSGAISGTPTNPGSFSFTVAATDSLGCTGSSNYTVNVVCPTITLSSAMLPDAVVRDGYAQLISGDAGIAPYNFTVTGGSLPPGLTLAGGGALTGTAEYPGSYGFIVTATDANGCVGSSNYTVNVTGMGNQLLILTNGTGSLKATKSKYGTPTNNAVLKSGTNYFITAVIPTGQIFSNWQAVATGVTNYTSTDPKFNFTFQSNLVLIATFTTNRFLAAAGSYNGLIESDLGDNGFFTVKVAPKNGKPATFSGQVNIDGTKTPIKGTFDLDGAGTFASGGVLVSLQLPFDNSGTISGTFTNVNGTSDMLGYVADGSAAYAGQYTMVVPGNSTDSTLQPGGDGYGLLKIDAKGTVKLTGGRLADASLFKQTVALGKGGIWPLYSTSAAGAIRGWLTVSNGSITGTLTWGSDGTGTGYTNGFELISAAQGELYGGTPALAALPMLTCGDGLLTTTVTNTAGKFTFAKTQVKKLVVTPTTGKVQLGIINGTAAGEGVVLGTNIVSGYLLHAGTSSWFDLQ